MKESDCIAKVLELAMGEDLECGVDITSDTVVSTTKTVGFRIVARENTVISVKPVLDFILPKFGVTYRPHLDDGERVAKGGTIASGEGIAATLLRVERIILNLIQRLCAIASMTREFVDKLSGTGVEVRATRKTTPGLRALELYAVKTGGGSCYRSSLSKKALVKDNHLISCASITAAVEKLKSVLDISSIGIECDTYEQVVEAAFLKVGMILLDNMSISMMKECVTHINNVSPDTKIDASGNISFDNILEVAALGVNSVSIGKLTHSVMSKDIAIDFYEL